MCYEFNIGFNIYNLSRHKKIMIYLTINILSRIFITKFQSILIIARSEHLYA
jgi:hypothetical protein